MFTTEIRPETSLTVLYMTCYKTKHFQRALVMEEMEGDHASTIDMIIRPQNTGERNTTKMPTSTSGKVSRTSRGNVGGERLPSKYSSRTTDLTPGTYDR